MSRFKQVSQMIFQNWMTVLYFEIIYKIFGFSVFFPLIRYLLSFLPKLAGVEYLGQGNVFLILKSPMSILLSLGILVLSALYITCEITAFMILSEMGWSQKKISLLGLTRQTGISTAGVVRPDRIGVLAMLPILMLSVFSPVSGYLKTIRLPEFIMEYIRNHVRLYGGFLLALSGFHILLFLYLFGLPAMLFDGKTFFQSWRESLRLLQGRKLRTAGTVAVLIVVFLVLMMALAAFAVLGIGGYTKVVYGDMEGRLQFQMYLLAFLRVFAIAGSGLAAVFLCSIIVSLYHELRGDTRPEAAEKTRGRVHILIQAGGGVTLVLILLLFGETEMGGGLLPPAGDPPRIIAHRAGAAAAPENTLAALKAAVQDGADMAEIDVQQLGDKTLIVMHDTNFKRTTGTDLDVWDADCGALRFLNAGAFFYRGNGAQPVPTLDEFLEEAKGKLRLMVELKTSGREKGLEKEVLDLIRKHGMEEQCIIASMNLDILGRIKELEPHMETVYISAILITREYELGVVDGYSVETTSLSREMALKAQLQGKKIYGWTANSNHSVKKALSCGVDGIITDYPLYVGYLISVYGKNQLVDEIAGLFYGK